MCVCQQLHQQITHVLCTQQQQMTVDDFYRLLDAALHYSHVLFCSFLLFAVYFIFCVFVKYKQNVFTERYKIDWL